MPAFPPSTSSCNPELTVLIERMKKLRGPIDIWLRKELAISRWIASFDSTGSIHRVLCKGEWRGPDYHLPAILIYNCETKKILAWCPEGGSDIMTAMDIHHFHSTIPHAAIAREVHDNSKGGSTL